MSIHRRSFFRYGGFIQVFERPITALFGRDNTSLNQLADIVPHDEPVTCRIYVYQSVPGALTILCRDSCFFERLHLNGTRIPGWNH